MFVHTSIYSLIKSNSKYLMDIIADFGRRQAVAEAQLHANVPADAADLLKDLAALPEAVSRLFQQNERSSVTAAFMGLFGLCSCHFSHYSIHPQLAWEATAGASSLFCDVCAGMPEGHLGDPIVRIHVRAYHK